MRVLKIIIFISFTLILACDKIKEPYVRFTETDDSVDPSICPRPVFTERATPVKKVLLEDFTGFLCPNCPTGAKEARALMTQYGEQLIVLAVHTGEFAVPDPSEGYPQDFRTSTGDALAAFFQVLAFPNGLVSRTSFRSNTVLYYDTWAAAVDSLTHIAPDLDIQIINEYDSVSHKLCSHIQTRFLKKSQKQLMLAVYLMEDSIHTKQKNNNPTIGTRPEIADYVQMHVLRKAVNSTWGSVISTTSDTLNVNDKINRSYSLILDSSWKSEHCSVIAFVYEANNKAIIQAEEHKVME